MKHFVISAFTIVLMLSNSALAINLGDIEVNSSFREPLKAVIPVLKTESDDTQESIEVMFADKHAFLNSKINRQDALDLISIDLVQDGSGNYYVALNSNKPINELFLELIVDVTTEDRRLSKEYTILMDPVDYEVKHNQQKLKSVTRKLTKVEPSIKKESHSMESSLGEGSHDMKGSVEESHSMESSIGEGSHDMKGSIEESHSMESSIGEGSHDMKGFIEESHSMESSIGGASQGM